jgi:hypothetical protein
LTGVFGATLPVLLFAALPCSESLSPAANAEPAAISKTTVVSALISIFLTVVTVFPLELNR